MMMNSDDAEEDEVKQLPPTGTPWVPGPAQSCPYTSAFTSYNTPRPILQTGRLRIRDIRPLVQVIVSKESSLA